MTQQIRYNLLALLTVGVWGITFVSTKILLSDGLTPTWIFITRFALAYICVLILYHKKLWSNSVKDELCMVAMGLTGGSFYFITENSALRLTFASNVSLIICTAPILTMFLNSIIYKNKVGVKAAVGSGLAISGVAIVVLNGSLKFGLNPYGDLLTFLAALSWASYCMLLKFMNTRYSNLMITRKVFFYGCLSALIYSIFEPFPELSSGYVISRVIFNLLFLSLIASFLCYIIWNKAVQVLGPNKTSNYIYFTPLITVIASTIILNEPISCWLIIGATVIIVGVYMSSK
ncbi:MAG: DMT family transporter [Muribaculaceae bacterium]|nr:DMT family transporter [Muribaculaceae bacterium]